MIADIINNLYFLLRIFIRVIAELIIIKVFNIFKILIARASYIRFIYITIITTIRILSPYIRFIFIISVFLPFLYLFRGPN